MEESTNPTRIAPFGLRMPPDLKARVQAAAEANNRSMNAEIVAVLEERYPKPKFSSKSIEEMFEYITSANSRPGVLARIDEMNQYLARTWPDIEAKFDLTKDGAVGLRVGAVPNS